MSTSTVSQDPTTTAASINSLPLEIKALIVNLAKLQDESFKERKRSDYRQVFVLVDDVLKENRWRGKSLNALFEVNKEWSDLAAVHVFKTITWKHNITSPIFKLIVLPRRVQFFRQIDFPIGGLLSERLGLILQSPMLHRLSLDRYATSFLFGDLVNPGFSGIAVQNLQWGIFIDLKLKITKVKLMNMRLTQVQAILKALPALTEINLEIKAGKEEEEMHKLGVLLAQYCSLKQLSLTFYTGSLPATWIDLEWKSASSLRTLSLSTGARENNQFNQTDLDFISMFNSTLERLNIESYTIASTPIPSSTFPKLTFLDIDTQSLCFSHFLQLFSASPIISLRYETMYKTDQSDIVSIDKTLAKYISGHPILQKLEICDRFLLLGALPEVEKVSKARQLVIKYSTWNDQLSNDPDPEWILSDQEHFDYRRPILKKVFNHGNDLLGKLEKENDVEGLKEMFDNCKWLRASLAESED